MPDKDPYKSLYTDRYGSTKNKDQGYVFGTFPNGKLSYDTSKFERERADGTTIIDLVPECRVFMFGTEVTKDVQTVSVKHALGGNQCTVKLTNPRDRYVVTKQDLVGNWREDKDFLATYDYDYLKRIPPSRPDILKLMTQNKKIGKYGHSLSDQIGQFASFFKPNKSPVTRMIFETKFYSGIDKKVGDFVFDYRDPIMVFMKGRFSPYWYFAFSGVIESWDEADTYGSEQSISVRSEDPLYLLKRHKFQNHASLFPAGNFETITRNIHSESKIAIYKKRLGADGTTIDTGAKLLFFGEDKSKSCHPIFSEFNKKTVVDTNAKNMKVVRKILEDDYSIGKFDAAFNFKETESDLMLTSGQNPSKWWWATGQKPSGYTVPISRIGSNGVQGGKLNSLPFGPWLGLYAQLNVINLPEYNASELMARYTSSVRFWEVSPQLGNTTTENSKDYSGWGDTGDDGDTLAIGAAGIHPAMTYEYINHFNILPGIWGQLYNGKIKEKNINPAIDNLNISPHDKIRELVVGSPTENRPEDSGKGSNVNLFRPRLFVVVPKKFTDTNRSIMTTAFGGLSFLQQDATTTYEALKEMCGAIQFSFYSSPMGDIFIEPEMHDFHPTEILISSEGKDLAKIEKRSIVQKKKSIRFRGINTGIEKKDLSDLAYMYNTKANHPFFLMEKDRIRCTQTFKPENIKTHIIVKGSVTGLGGTIDKAFQTKGAHNIGLLNGGRYNVKEDKGFNYGIYVADGFGFKIDRSQTNITVDPVFTRQRIEYLTKNYKKTIWSQFLKVEKNSTFLVLFQKAAVQVKALAIEEFEWKTGFLSKVRVSINNNTFDEVDSQSQILYGMSLTIGQLIVINELAKSTLNIIASTNALNKSIAGVGGVSAGLINNSVLYNPFSDIKGTSTVKNWLRSDTHEQVAKVTANMNDQGTKRKGKLENIAETVRFDLLTLYEPVSLADEKIRGAYEEILLEEKSIDQKIPPMLNMSKLKELEQAGIYNPRLDVSRKFGYNKGPEITNVMVNNGAEASRYAVTMFNKLYSQAHKISMDIIGRPELLLNKPYYCERKDAIGLLDNYSLNFSVGSDFQSSLGLTYVRKNSLTYKYTLGTLDELVGTTNNDYFEKAAINYFKSTADIRNNFTNDVLKRAMTAQGNLLGSTIAKGGSDKIIKSKFKLKGTGFTGGLYTAHDRIGHMEYDKLGTDSKLSSVPGKSEIKDPKMKNLVGYGENLEALGTLTFNISVEIKYNLDELISIEMLYDETIEKLEKQTAKTEQLKIKKLKLTNNTNHEAGDINTELDKSQKEEIILARSGLGIEAKHKAKCFEIYGVDVSSYSNPGKATKPKQSAGERIPDIATVEELDLNSMDSKSLYYKFYSILANTKGIIAYAKLIDDRTVGHTLKGFDAGQVAKIGWKGETPFYAHIKGG